jgi:hypothetical protein
VGNVYLVESSTSCEKFHSKITLSSNGQSQAPQMSVCLFDMMKMVLKKRISSYASSINALVFFMPRQNEKVSR